MKTRFKVVTFTKRICLENGNLCVNDWRKVIRKLPGKWTFCLTRTSTTPGFKADWRSANLETSLHHRLIITGAEFSFTFSCPDLQLTSIIDLRRVNIYYKYAVHLTCTKWNRGFPNSVLATDCYHGKLSALYFHLEPLTLRTTGIDHWSNWYIWSVADVEGQRRAFNS